MPMPGGGQGDDREEYDAMARLTIELDLDNAAFEEDRGDEVARILRALADDIVLKGARGGHGLFDLNGNSVGRWSVTAQPTS